MASNNNTTPPIKKANVLDELKGIKCTKLPNLHPKTDAERDYAFNITPGNNTGYRRKKKSRQVLFSAFRSNPLPFLKRFPTMQEHTNATDAQMELITKTSITKLQEISNGK